MPTIYHRVRCEMVGTLALCPPYGATESRRYRRENSEQCLCGWRGRDRSYWTGHHNETVRMLPSQRALFDIPRDICYLNAASYSPLPIRTLEAGRAAVGRKGRPWTLEASFANQQHERARTAAARLIHAEPSDIALIPSISYGVATAAKLLTIARGTRVLVLENDHSSPVLEWHARAEAQGFTVETVRQPDDGDWTSAVLESIERYRRAAGQPRLDLIGALVGRRADRCRQGRCGAPAAGRGLPDRRDAKRRRAGDGRAASRSGFRDLPDLQMAARTLRPRLSLCRQTTPERHPAGADLRRPPQRARRERGLFHRPRLRSRCASLRHGRARSFHLDGDGLDRHGDDGRMGRSRRLRSASRC